MCGVTPWPIGRMMVSSLNGMDQKAVDVADRPRLLGVLADLPLAFKAGTECSCMPKRQCGRTGTDRWTDRISGGHGWQSDAQLGRNTVGTRSLSKPCKLPGPHACLGLDIAEQWVLLDAGC